MLRRNFSTFKAKAQLLIVILQLISLAHANQNATVHSEIVGKNFEKKQEHNEALHGYAKNAEPSMVRDARNSSTNYAFVSNERVSHKIVNELRIRHQRSHDSALSATLSPTNFCNFYAARIRSVTAWKPFAGYKASLDISRRINSKKFLKNGFVRLEDEWDKVRYIFDLANFVGYVHRKSWISPSMRLRDAVNRTDYNFFFNCENTLIGLNAAQSATISLKNGSEFVEMHGNVQVADMTDNRLLFGRNISSHQEIRALSTSWTEVFPHLNHVSFKNRFSNIFVENGVSAQLSAFNTTFTLNTSSIRMRASSCNYTCALIRDEIENTIKIPWRANELAQFKMSKKSSTAILYKHLKSTVSYLTLLDKLTSKTFQFKPNRNRISMNNSPDRIEYDAEQGIVLISEAESGYILATNSIIKCFHRESLSALALDRDSLSIKAGEDGIFLFQHFVSFCQGDCFISILVHMIKNKDYKFNKNCACNNGSSAKVSISDGRMHASYGRASLTLRFEKKSLQIETTAGNITRSAAQLFLNCGWATAQTTHHVFSSEIWKIGEEEAKKPENVTDAPSNDTSSRERNDIFIISSKRSNFSKNSTHTRIDTMLGSMLLNSSTKKNHSNI